MKSIKMDAGQTKTLRETAWDDRYQMMMHLREQAREICEETGESVEIRTVDGELVETIEQGDGEE